MSGHTCNVPGRTGNVSGDTGKVSGHTALVMNVSVVNFTLVPRRFVKVSVTRFTLSVVFSEEMSLFLLQHYLFSGRMQKLV